MKTKNVILSVTAAFVLGWVCNYTFCPQERVSEDFREKLLIDTRHKKITDTSPKLSKEDLTRYVYIQVKSNSSKIDSCNIDSSKIDSVPLAVVQRTYTDDSTYTAYVSGVLTDSFPRLDSIAIKQRYIYIEHEIERIKEKKPPITFGLQSGIGYGIIGKKPDIYIGIGMQWNF